MIIVFSRIFIIDLNFREIGFAYAASLQELSNTIYYIYYLYKREDFSFRPDFYNNSGKLKYCWKSFVTSFSFYGNFIAFEINSYFAALLHDPNKLAIWVSLTYTLSIIYFINIGISFNIRNLIGHQIGLK